MKFAGIILGMVMYCLIGAPVEAQQGPPNIEITIGGSTNALDSVVADLREQLISLQIEPEITLVETIEPAEVITPQSDASPMFLRIWIDMDGEEVSLFFVNAGWERVERRRVALEQVGSTVAEVVAARLEEAERASLASIPSQLPSEPPQPEPPQPELPQPEPPSTASAAPTEHPDQVSPGTEDEEEGEPQRPRSFLFGIGYGLNLWSGATTPLHGAEAWIALVFNRVRFAPDLRLAFGFRLDGALEGEEVRLDYGQSEIRVMTSLEVFRSQRVGFRIGLGAGIDLLTVEPVEPATEGEVEASLGEQRTVVIPAVRAAFEVTIRVSAMIAISVGAAVDFDCIDLTLAVGNSEERSIEFEPFLVRPIFYGALIWRLR